MVTFTTIPETKDPELRKEYYYLLDKAESFLEKNKTTIDPNEIIKIIGSGKYGAVSFAMTAILSAARFCRAYNSGKFDRAILEYAELQDNVLEMMLYQKNPKYEGRPLLITEITADMKAGVGVNLGGRKGRQARDRDKKEQWAKYQNKVDELHNKSPGLSHKRLCELAGSHFQVSWTTIRDRTKNPRK